MTAGRQFLHRCSAFRFLSLDEPPANANERAHLIALRFAIEQLQQKHRHALRKQRGFQLVRKRGWQGKHVLSGSL